MSEPKKMSAGALDVYLALAIKGQITPWMMDSVRDHIAALEAEIAERDVLIRRMADRLPLDDSTIAHARKLSIID